MAPEHRCGAIVGEEGYAGVLVGRCGERASWVYREYDKAGYRCEAHMREFRQTRFATLFAEGMFELKRLDRGVSA